MGEHVKLCGKVGPRDTICIALDTHVGGHDYASAARRAEAVERTRQDFDAAYRAPATPPVQQQAAREADLSWTLNKPRGETRTLSPEAPTPPLGKCGTCYGTREVGHAVKDANGRQVGNELRPCPDCTGGAK